MSQATEPTPMQWNSLCRGTNGWFEPVGREWRTCDGLLKRGLMEHNGDARGEGERYRTTITGRQLLRDTLAVRIAPSSPKREGGAAR